MQEQMELAPRLESNIVSPSGPLDARICFIGQAPGEEEDAGLEPFIGAAGQFLSQCLRIAGIVRSECLFNNLFIQRPPKNDVGYYFEDKSKTRLTWEGKEHLENLRRWLEDLPSKPNVIVALGREAMMALTGKKRIWKWRGSLLPCTLVPGLKVYPTFHPSGVLRLLNEPQEKLQGEKKTMSVNVLPLFLRDLERIKIQSEWPELRLPVRKTDYNLTYEEILAKLEWLDEENIDASVDIETLSGPEGPMVWMIGFSPRPDYGFVVFFLRDQRFAWPIQREAVILDRISKFFLNRRVKKIFQNGTYDLSILGRYYGLRVASGTYEDIMWLHHASFPQLKKDLATQCSIYTWEQYYKDDGKVHLGKRNTDVGEAIYNGKDICTTREIYDEVRRLAMEMGTYEGYRRSMSVIPSLLAMMIRGVRIDVAEKEKLQNDFGLRVKQIEAEIKILEGETINLNSSQQIQKLLYYKHGFDVVINRKTKKPTTDKDALNKLARKYPNEKILQLILDHRKFAKLLSTYADMTLEADGRVRTSYDFISTWRLSSKESHFGGGGNLQNIPTRTDEGKMIRRLFIPDEMEPYDEAVWPRIVALVAAICGEKVASTLHNGEKLLLAPDLSQAEARVVTWEAQDEQMMEAFLDPTVDVHWERTKEIFELPSNLEYKKHDAEFVDKYTEEPHSHYDLRRLGKTIKHATNYGMGPYQLQTILAREGFILEYKVCVALLEDTLARDFELQNWQRGIRDTVRATRILYSAFGRKRYFFGRLNDNLWRAAYAFSPQSTVGEVLEVGIQTIEDEAPWIENLLNVHDEVVAQVPPHTVAQSILLMKQALEIPLEIHDRELIIPADFKAGPNWGDLVEFKPDLALCEQFIRRLHELSQYTI